MADGPWTKYQSSGADSGPWDKYKSAPGTTTDKPPQAPVSTGMDVAKGAGSGLVEGTESAVTFPAEIGGYLAKKAVGNSEMGGMGGNALESIFGNKGLGLPQSLPDAVDKLNKKVGVSYDPQTTPGKIAKFGGELVPALGGTIGAGVKEVGKAAGKLVTKDNASLLDTARKFDIPVFRSQVSKSAPTKMAGSLMKDIPFSGTEGKITEQVEKFNNAVMKAIGGSGSVTPENLGKTYDRLSKTYQDLTGKYNIKVTPELDNDLLKLADDASVQLAGDPAKLKAFNDYWELAINNMKDGSISGKTYQRIRSGIGNTLRGDNSSPELGQLQKLIDDHFEAAMPAADAKKFQETRTQYRRMIAVEKVLKTGDKGQGISPARLQGAVKQVFGNYAYGGDDDLEQLAQLGTILKDTFPQSGTGPRTQAMDLAKKMAGTFGIGAAGAGTVGLPATIAGLGGGMVAGRYGLTPYLYQNVAKSPYAQKAIDDFLKQAPKNP